MAKNDGDVELNEEPNKQNEELYAKFRDDCLTRQLSNTESFDKAIVTLSSAGLAISLTFFRYVIPVQLAEYLWLVKFSWALFILAIITSIIAYFVSNKAIDIQLNIAHKYYIENEEDAYNTNNGFDTFNKYLNISVAAFFCIAIIVFALFVTINLHSGDQEMSEKKQKPTMTKIEKVSSLKHPSVQNIVIENSKNIVIERAEIPKMQNKAEPKLKVYSAHTPPMQKIKKIKKEELLQLKKKEKK